MTYPEHRKKSVIAILTEETTRNFVEDVLRHFLVDVTVEKIDEFMRISENRLQHERLEMEDVIRRGDQARAMLGLPSPVPPTVAAPVPLGTPKPNVGSKSVTVVSAETVQENNPVLQSIVDQETGNNKLDAPKEETVFKEKHPEVVTKFGTRLATP